MLGVEMRQKQKQNKTIIINQIFGTLPKVKIMAGKNIENALVMQISKILQKLNWHRKMMEILRVEAGEK